MRLKGCGFVDLICACWLEIQMEVSRGLGLQIERYKLFM